MNERPLGFIKAIQFTLPWECGKDKDGNLKDTIHYRDEGLPTKYGIWKGANPEVDVENLTLEAALEIYKRKYWDVYLSLKPVSANLAGLPTALAVGVFDSGVNCGPARALGWLGKALENKNPTKTLLDSRGAYYFNLITTNKTKYQPNYKGWMNRLTDLRKFCDVLEAEVQNNADIVERLKAAGAPQFFALGKDLG